MDKRADFEEMELDRYIEQMDKEEIPVPDALDARIRERIGRIRPKRRIGRIIAAACIGFVILFVGGVKLSPDFAAYAAGIPGLDLAVGLLRGDKGIENAKETEEGSS